MANGDITIRRETRPCYVDGRKAIWHQWVDVPADGDALALVEYENGKVEKVGTRYFKFADHGAFRETAWE